MLLLSASAGAGHVRAAQALERALREAGARDVRHVDALEYTTKLFRRLYQQAYLDMVNHAPEVLGWLYDHLDKPSKYERRRLAWDRFNTRPFVELLEGYRPEWTVWLKGAGAGSGRGSPWSSRTSTSTGCGSAATWTATSWPSTRRGRT
jgi:processive 1,2-diacylglycerol beta-glucosyltransferase